MKRTVAFLIAGLVAISLGGLALAGLNNNSSIHLAGKFEVPMRDTNAQGQAIFHIADDGQSVAYKLIGSNIENAFMGHIHCGSPTVNGPIVVWLYPSTAPVAGPSGAGRHDGVLSQGTFTDANVIDRAPSATCPGGVDDLADVLELLQNGGGYVNVHTDQLPGGEIRGNTP
ncbi:MAG: CHRD domain-containing protein [Gaiellaceae bacterium]